MWEITTWRIRLLAILRDPVLNRIFLVLIYSVLFMVDSSLTEPFWLYVFEKSKEDAQLLSQAVAVIYLILAFVASKLLARSEKILVTIGISIFLLLSVFSFLGQAVAAELASNPLENLFSDGSTKETSLMQSYRHWISTGITMVLFSCAVFLEYLVARADEEVKDVKKSLAMASFLQWLQSKIKLLKGEYNRASKKLNVLAKDKVNDRIETLNNQISACEQKERQLLGEQHYQDELIDLMHEQRMAIIEAVYAKKPSFFKRLFS